MYRLNPFVYVFEKEEYIALYNSLSLDTAFMEKGKYNKTRKISNELLENGFYVDCNFNSFEYFNNFHQKNLKNQSIDIAYFLVTSVCNYNCKYCTIESRFNEHSENIFMKQEIAYKGIKLLERNTKKVKIIFYGGEPLLNFDIIRYTVNEARKTKLDTKFSIITNGSIINNEIIEFIKDNNISLSVSLDGNKETNDAVRVFADGKGTFDVVKNNLNKLRESNCKFGISCTISPANINNLQEIIDILKDYNIRSFGFNLLSENKNVKIKNNDMVLVTNILKIEDIIFDNKIIEDKIINRKLRSFIEKRNWTRECAGYGRQISITPSGDVGPCHNLWPDKSNGNKDSYFEINVDYEKSLLDHPVWKEWFSRTPLNMPQCWNCYGIGLCGGGCAKNSLLRKGSIWEIDEDICLITKESIKWVIWKYFYSKNIKEKI
jgi:uncharacterized protein